MKGKRLSASERLERAQSDKGERRKIFNELCRHLEEGYSLDCFGVMSDVTIKKWLDLYKEEWPRVEFDNALRYGKHGWERIGRKQANGECLGNSRSWYYNMSNRYGWRDKVDIEAEHKGNLQVNVVSYASTKASHNDESDE
jgi:hypothetical protein